MNRLTQIQAWYAAQCDGQWEHNFGLSINTLDNPGWSVAISISETALEHIEFIPMQEELSETDWIECWIGEDGVFQGAGDPTKLEAILGVFLDWAEQNAPQLP